jgi:type I restriction enzyme, S subunit
VTWPTTRLKNVARVSISNVDKKTVPGEPDVRVCNYVDVYKNAAITPDMGLMRATASVDQVRTFRVLVGDTLITKDSETADDIAVPAFVAQSTPDMVCGYHLALVRPSQDMHPKYLYWALASLGFQSQMTASATGVTRFGLRQEFVGNGTIPRPPLEEQRRIADFLDAETARIDRLSAKRRRMKELLAFKRECTVEFELGVDGAGSTEHALVPLKYLADEITVGIVITPARWYVDHDGVPALRGVNVRAGRIVRDDVALISAQGHAANNKSRLHAGDVVVVRTGQAGAAAVVPPDFDGANCIDLIVIRPGRKLAPRYVEYVLNSGYAGRRVDEYSVGSIQGHFNVGAMKQIPFPALPRSDQERAVDRIDSRVEPIDHLIRKLAQQDSVLQERRRALITAAVTGKFDVTTAGGREVTG